MAPPTQLDPTEQDALVKQIGLALLRSAPEDWDRVTVDYRAMGRYAEADGEITFANNTTSNWSVPPDIVAMFAQLRAGMYRDGRGTWYNAKYRLDHPSSYNLDYDRDEPQWHKPPPPQAYADDLQTFPRSDENIPEWLRRRANGRPEQQPPRFRVARIFDGQGGNGRPLVNRPTVPEAERPDLLGYLNAAPVVGPSRGMDVDRLDPDGRPLVPVAFHTDGTWIWPAAVNYYLHTYGISPELELVGHIRRHGGHVPDVDESTRAAAAAFLGRGAPVPPPGPPMRQPAPAAPPRRAPEPGLQPTVAVPRGAAGQQPTMVAPPPGLDLDATQLAPRPEAPEPTMFAPRPDVAEPTMFAPRPPEVPEPTMLSPRPPVVPPPSTAPELLPPAGLETVLAPKPPEAAPPPAAALPSQGPPSATIDSLRSRLQDLGVPESAYRIGPPVERGWTMDQTPEGWRVGWYDNEFVAPAMFEDVADAAAFMLGKIMLDNGSTRGPEDESTLVADPVEPNQQVQPPPRTGPFEPPARVDDLSFPPPKLDSFEPPRDEPAFAPPPPNGLFEPHRDDRTFQLPPEPFTPPRDDLGSQQPREPFAPPRDFQPPSEPFAPPRDDRGFQPPEPFAQPRDDLGHQPPPTSPRDDRGYQPQSDPFASPRDDLNHQPPPRSESPRGDRGFQPPEPFTQPREDLGYQPPASPRDDRGFQPQPAPFASPRDDLGYQPQAEPFAPARDDRGFQPPSDLFAPPRDQPDPFGPPRDDLGFQPQQRIEPEQQRANEQPASPQQRWAIQPLSGEPPLTLFRGKRMLDLPPGTEIDRFGNPDGNLTYAVGTSFTERSLVPEWIERPYHAYRVERPLQVLSGTAIPWFEQVGGGMAYLLPEAIHKLLAAGVLVEIPGRKPPA